jgi:hypothetical protein
MQKPSTAAMVICSSRSQAAQRSRAPTGQDDNGAFRVVGKLTGKGREFAHQVGGKGIQAIAAVERSDDDAAPTFQRGELAELLGGGPFAHVRLPGWSCPILTKAARAEPRLRGFSRLRFGSLTSRRAQG